MTPSANAMNPTQNSLVPVVKPESARLEECLSPRMVENQMLSASQLRAPKKSACMPVVRFSLRDGKCLSQLR